MIELAEKRKTIQEQVSTVGDNGQPTDINDGLGNAIYASLALVAIVAVIVIIIGGVSIATSQGDPGKIKKGKSTVLYGVIGMVVCIFAFAIVAFVLNNIK